MNPPCRIAHRRRLVPAHDAPPKQVREDRDVAVRLKRPVGDLVIVKGFPAVWWLTQMGIPNVVGIMDSSISDAQLRIVAEVVPQTGRIWIMPPGHSAGEQDASEMLRQISPFRFTRWVKLDPEKQPTDYPGGWLKEALR